MMHDLPFNLVKLVPCPRPPFSVAPMPLREMAYRQNAWLPTEIATLRVLFDADEAPQAIAYALERPLSGVTSKIAELGLRRNSSRPWTELDDAYLAQHYGVEATNAIAAIQGRSVAAIYARAGFLQLTDGNAPAYTEWEIAQIRAGYGQGVPVAQLGVLIGRPPSGIATVASRLKIRHANAPEDWSDAEQHRALELAETGRRYRLIAADLTAEGFARREPGAIGQVLRKLGYGRGWGRPWTAEEDDLVRAAYRRGDSLTPLQSRLGRSRTSITWRAGDLGLKGTHARPNGWRTDPPWANEEILVLRRDYGQIPTPELAKNLNRSKGGVFNKAWSLGLQHGYIRPVSADEDRAIRLARDHGISLTDLSAALERDPAVISKYAIREGIPFSTRPVPAPRGPRATRPVLTLSMLLALDDGRRIPSGPARVTLSRHLTIEPPIEPAPSALPALVIAMPDLAGLPTSLLHAMNQAGLLRIVGAGRSIALVTADRTD